MTKNNTCDFTLKNKEPFPNKFGLEERRNDDNDDDDKNIQRNKNDSLEKVIIKISLRQG